MPDQIGRRISGHEEGRFACSPSTGWRHVQTGDNPRGARLERAPLDVHPHRREHGEQHDHGHPPDQEGFAFCATLVPPALFHSGSTIPGVYCRCSDGPIEGPLVSNPCEEPSEKDALDLMPSGIFLGLDEGLHADVLKQIAFLVFPHTL